MPALRRRDRTAPWPTQPGAIDSSSERIGEAWAGDAAFDPGGGTAVAPRGAPRLVRYGDSGGRGFRAVFHKAATGRSAPARMLPENGVAVALCPAWPM